MDKPTNAEKEFLDKLKLLTKSKEKWEVAIDDVAKGLSEKYSSALTAKVLWLLGEMGLKYSFTSARIHWQNCQLFGKQQPQTTGTSSKCNRTDR
ncbi:hypothetical protein [Alloprevotella tannerae]|uniref:hypothetical protein n=1 Tax=Alloprevotella tannerae TaxID=76122 RepID=UPI0028EFC1A8|nr:hypothetical protein [Alloprevotella tannerae]